MGNARTIDYRFKLLYAFGIVLVLCAHADGGAISILKEWFPYDGTYLTLFAFASGYLYRITSEEDIGGYLLRKIKTLLIPLYLYNFAYAALVWLSRMKGFEIGEDPSFYSIFILPITNGHQFLYNMGGWFIIPLFMIEVFNILIRKLLSFCQPDVKEFAVFLVDLVLGITGNILASKGYNTGWWLVLVRMLFFLPFFGFGGFYRTTLEPTAQMIPDKWFFCSIFLIKLCMNLKYGIMPTFVPAWCTDFNFSPVTSILSGYLVALFWMRIFTKLEPSLGRNKTVNLIADNSYCIMINHFMGFMIVKTICALFSHVLPALKDFDWVAYKTDIWWFYKPNGAYAFLAVYVAAGIAFPLLLKKVLVLLKEKIHPLLRSKP